MYGPLPAFQGALTSDPADGLYHAIDSSSKAPKASTQASVRRFRKYSHRQREMDLRLNRLEQLVQQAAQTSLHMQLLSNTTDDWHRADDGPSIGATMPARDGSMTTESLDQRLGKLILDKGESHFVGPSYWALLGEEVQCLDPYPT